MSLLEASTPKCVAEGASRSVLPAETLARVAPYLSECGITRVANITGLDRIGIPIWQAIRPASRALSVSQGKGLDDDSARIGAIMESLEQHLAERTEVRCRIDSYRALVASYDVVEPELLPVAVDSTYDPALTIPWCEAVDVRAADGDAPVWVPFELVHADAVLPRIPGSGCFLRSTNGLASGNITAEAVLHGLCELVERDAHSLWRLGEEERAAETRVDLDTIEHPSARSLLDRLDAARMAVALWDMTSDLGVPVYRCILSDRDMDVDVHPVPASYGAGCHPDPAIAMTRALTESAQSRLASIAGSRDDLTRAGYHRTRVADTLVYHQSTAADERRPVDARRRPSLAGDTIEDDLRAVVERLATGGLDQVLWVDLSREGWPVAVVRVIVPGLEGPSSSPVYRPGRRALRAAA